MILPFDLLREPYADYAYSDRIYSALHIKTYIDIYAEANDTNDNMIPFDCLTEKMEEPDYGKERIYGYDYEWERILTRRRRRKRED